MSRPTRYCTCGEYVADKDAYNSATDRFELKLVHIDVNGNTIFRSHKAMEDKR